MLLPLDPSNIDDYIHGPGVAFLEWRHPLSTQSVLLDQELERTSEAHPDVRFGSVDVSQEGNLARDFNVQSIPTLMIYRDGILVFSRPGIFPQAALESLVSSIFSLDMTRLEGAVNGHSQRVAVTLTTSDEDDDATS